MKRNEAGPSGHALESEAKSRSIRIKGLPERTQEGLLHGFMTSQYFMLMIVGKKGGIIRTPVRSHMQRGKAHP